MQGRGRRATQRAAIVAIVMLIAGCVVTPDPLTRHRLAGQADADRATLHKTEPPIRRPLSEQEAVARAILYNRDRHVATMKAALARNELSAASYGMLPSLTAEAGYTTRSEYSAVENVPFVDGSPRGDLSTDVFSVAREKNRHVYGAGFTWSILDFGLSYVRAHQQADRYLISVENERKALQNLARQTRTAYWRAVSARRLLDKVGPLMARVDNVLADSREITRQRLSDPLTHYSRERGLLDVKRSLQNLREELIGSRQRLARLMGLPPDTVYSLARHEGMARPRAVFDVDTMERTALIQRPEILQASYSERIARDDAKAALLGMFPDLSLSAGYQHDSNDFLRYNDWVSAGVSVSYDLLDIFRTRARHRAAKTGIEIARQQRLATALAVLTQVHLAALQYETAKARFDTATRYLTVSRSISDLVTRQAAVDPAGQLAEISEQRNALVAELHRDLAYAGVQNAFSRIYQSIGLDPYPARSGDTPERLAQSIMNRRKIWEAGYIGVVVQPIDDQHPVLAPRPGRSGSSFTFAADTFTVGGRVTYRATSDAGPLPDWLHFDPATRTFRADAGAPPGRIPITITATNQAGALASDSFALRLAAGHRSSGTLLAGSRRVTGADR